MTGIYAEKIFLNIYLKERPRLAKFSINGVKKSDVDNIREKIKLVSGDYVTDNLVMKTTNIIRKYYTDKGFLNAEVDSRLVRDTGSANQVTLIFNINRHGKVKVYAINVHGNTSLSNEQLKGAFKKTKELSMFNPMDDLDLMLYHAVGAALKLDFLGMINVIEQHAFENVRVRIFKSSKFIEEDYDEDKMNLISKYNSLRFPRCPDHPRFDIEERGQYGQH